MIIMVLNVSQWHLLGMATDRKNEWTTVDIRRLEQDIAECESELHKLKKEPV